MIISAKENKAIALRWFGVQTAAPADLAIMDQLTAPNFIYHNPSNPEVRTHGQRKQKIVIPLTKSFPKMKMTINDVIAEGDKVAIRYFMTGVQRREFMGIPPTNKRINLSSICILRLANGKVAEMWVENNSLVMMMQLGVIPLPAGELHIKS